MNQSNLMTIEEIATVFQVTPKTIQRWDAAGVIPAAIREGRIVRYDATACRRALARRAKAKVSRPAQSEPATLI